MRRFIAFIMTAVMLLCLSVCVFADDGQESQYTLHMDRNGKTLLDADGNSVNGIVREKAIAEFYRIMRGIPVNWVEFNYTELEVNVDGEENVTLGKQTFSLLDGTFRTSSNAEVGLYVLPDKYLASGDGEVTFTIVGFDGTEVGSVTAVTELDEYGNYAFNCPCRNCDENQDNCPHIMICGHYVCEEGAVGHGAGACGTPGHMNCDGTCHDLCTNCQQPLCSGMHGEGVCEHVHQWIVTPEWAVCETCGAAVFEKRPEVNLVP